MISVNQLSMAYGEKLLFHEVSHVFAKGRRYALVGANGSGKSTFLRLLTGEEEPVSGLVSIPKDCTVGWLKQDQFRYENTQIQVVVLQGRQQLWRAMQEKDDILKSEVWDDDTVRRLSHCEDIIQQLDGYEAAAFAEKLLNGLGIATPFHQQPLSSLSGGFKLRVLLAQVLFARPDILLLDEPTNHLDVISIRWLENYLSQEFPGLVIFISHDVAFIDRLADCILDVDYGEIRQYSGQYDRFLAEKKQGEEQILHTKRHMEIKIAKMQEFIDRNRAKASRAGQAQSRIRMIEKMEMPEVRQSSRQAPLFQFRLARPSSKKVLSVSGLVKTFKGKTLFHQASFDIHRGDKVAIIGENGAGKSTLLKILLGRIQQDEGEFVWGNHTEIHHFAQDHHDHLDRRIGLLAWLSSELQGISEQLMRKVLGQVLFGKDDIEKNILSLSGGEAARLLLARIMLQPANVLVLDEPTNHLDIESSSALAEALSDYPGTLLFVSHDRHFIHRIASRVFSLSRDLGLQECDVQSVLGG